MKKYLLTIVSSSLLFGLEFTPLGFTPAGMGGAGVASAKGSLALYYNPALLAKHNYTVEFSLGSGLGIREYNLINRINKLANEYKLTTTLENIKNNAPNSKSNEANGDNIKLKKALNELYALSQGNGLSIIPTAEFSAQIGKFGIGVFGVGDLTTQAVIDREHLYTILKDPQGGGYYYYNPDTDVYGATDKLTYEKHSLQYALENKLTYLNVNGIVLAEVPIGYAYTFDLINSQLSIGVGIKYMQGATYKTKLEIDSNEDELQNSLNDNSKISSAIGVDLGVLLTSDKMSLGLVGKYLNSPKFQYYDGSEYKINPMIRAGISIDLTNWINIAMDIDLTKNDTSIKDYKSQYIGGGINFHQSWFSIRAGLMQNMLQEEEGIIITTGLGFGLKWLQLDLSAQASTKQGTFKNANIPRYTKFNLALISRWGG